MEVKRDFGLLAGRVRPVHLRPGLWLDGLDLVPGHCRARIAAALALCSGLGRCVCWFGPARCALDSIDTLRA